jgi:hypothetical protein
MVTAFNTILLELSIMAKSPIDINDATALNPSGRDLPEEFAKMKKLKKFNGVVLIDFNFRGIPGKQGQHYTFGGRADVYFRAYGLSDDEIELLKYRLEKSDLNSSLNLVEGMTTESLMQIQADIDEFLPSGEEKKPESSTDPFSALFSFFEPKVKKNKKETEEEKNKRLKAMNDEVEKRGQIKPDNFAEKYIRSYAEVSAANLCFSLYDKYKKAHGMVHFPYDVSEEYGPPQTEADKLFGFK